LVLADVVVAHYSEISLRGANRGRYVALLVENIRLQLGGSISLKHVDARIIGAPVGEDFEQVEAKLSKVFGVAWLTTASLLPHDYGAVRDKSVELALKAKGGGAKTFAVRVRRSGDHWVTNSLELAAKLGAEVKQATGLAVDLENPDLTIYVDVIKDGALVYTHKLRGPGGLPLGSTGRVVHLLSGGVDSAVAAWQLMKRGVKPFYLHFYAYPSVELLGDSKVVRVAQSLAVYSGISELMVVPFTKYQLASIRLTERLEPVLFRYFMRRFAERLAEIVGAKAVSFGDSLGQVASQTLENIGAVDQGARLPVLRPMLTYNKQETVDLAKRLGLYEQTTIPYKDCCAIVTRHPETRVDREAVRDAYEKLGLEDLIDQLLKESHVITVDAHAKQTETQRFEEWLSARGGRVKADSLQR